MYKLYTLIVLIVLVGVAKARLEPLSTNNLNQNYNLRTMDYINVNRQLHNKTIQDMDTQLDMLKQIFEAGLKTIYIQQGMLIGSLNQMEEKMRAQEHLSDLSQKCVAKYRPLVPTITQTKTKMNSCVAAANYKLSDVLSAPNNTRNNMQNYYQNTFEGSVASCQRRYPSLPLNYTLCVTDVVAFSSAYTIKTQKTFGIEMDTAQCASDAYIKQALDCSYTIESNAISGIAEANTLINKCIWDQANCEHCNTCSEVYNMYRSDVSYTNTKMDNPFYQRNQATKCMLIKLI